ncbi:MAG: anhydro-N-acetylmuramic acid kinase [Candidatus Sumerlaeaceae bacterium]|nr:anhydro-N-acetylmuramic acid kinase [Candidatus Sumerlaeaceae bacterium]
MNPATIIGMISGTSVDSIDAALCEISATEGGRLSARLLAFHEQPISPDLRGRIFRVFENGPASLALACSLNVEIGEAFADAALALIEKAGGPDKANVSAIASHGQTVYHIAPHMAGGPDSLRASTLQIGEGAVIAERTDLPVVCDFRVADMAAGGNGAPLVPFADFHLFSEPGKTVIVQNIGGIANGTVLPASGRMEDVIAFDTGPGNMIIDAFTSHFYPGESFDRDGRHAANGNSIPDLLDPWMAIPYITAPPPKSTGRELFGLHLARQALASFPGTRADDLIATATLFTARSIARNYADHVLPKGPIAKILLGGGGAHNSTLVEMLRTEMATVANPTPQLISLDEAGFPAKARECIAFAMLGYARLNSIPANVPSATGARHPAILGKLVSPPPS